MYLSELRAFVALCDSGSIQAAAKQLHLSQPAVSRQIQRLEEFLGTTLLDRSVKPPRLAPQGRKALPQCRKLLQEWQQLQQLFQPQLASRCRLGLSNGATHLLDGPQLQRLRQHFPQLELSISCGWSHELLQQVAEGQLDILLAMVGPRLKLPSAIHHHPLHKESLSLIGPLGSEHPQSWAELDGASFVVLPQGCGQRRLLLHRLQQHQASPGGLLEVGSYNLQLEWIAAGAGYGYIPTNLLRHQAPRGVEALDWAQDDHNAQAWLFSRPQLGELQPLFDWLSLHTQAN
ncbi:LysR family transcriptional regulator [Balneatrix alpica]|uniref:LysR family transcriptional regulator n=1 Tax=Balneatrix alpica TaxID=75684 RepID=A0ABV5ZD67_9GAMM|nr:LysR family transcriptional regulator [Balneatrix alpica]